MNGLRTVTLGTFWRVTLAPLLAAAAFGAWGSAIGDTAVGPAGKDAAALVGAYNRSGHELFRILAAQPGNAVLSPYSIGTAMAMALAGARGDTAVEMAGVLGLKLPRESVDSASADVLAGLNEGPSALVLLRIANALMTTDEQVAIAPSYESALRDKYAAEVFRGADLSRVNGWVRQKTEGKIESIFDRLDAGTALVLLDAIYFKARWQTAFAPKATRNDAFHLAKSTVEVPTMHIHSEFALAERPGYRAIRLPYADDRFGMLVVLPDADVGAALERIDSNELRSLADTLGRTPARTTEVSLPRFQASFKTSLVEPFAKMGMHRAFDLRTADFSRMTGKPRSELPLAIGQIVHRAIVEVAEEGTEAAAATGIAVPTASLQPPHSETFRVDRAFLFAIVDNASGAVLFEGRIADPRQVS